MANRGLKEIKDISDGKLDIDAIRWAKILKGPEIPDRFGPIKYDAYEGIWRSYLDLMPVVAQRIDAIEEYLVTGLPGGKPFIRPEERPDVAAGALTEVAETMRLLEQRVAKLEAGQKR